MFRLPSSTYLSSEGDPELKAQSVAFILLTISTNNQIMLVRTTSKNPNVGLHIKILAAQR